MSSAYPSFLLLETEGILGKFLFKLARIKIFGFLVGFCFQYLHFLFPLKWLKKSKYALALPHPKPFWQNHAVVVPKKVIPTLLTLTKPNNQTHLKEILRLISELAKQPPYNKGYGVCVNGGSRQDVYQVHFHLFSQTEAKPLTLDKLAYQKDDISLYQPCQPDCEVHLVVKMETKLSLLSGEGQSIENLVEIFKLLPELTGKFNLVELGYSLVLAETRDTGLVGYITAGKTLNHL
jgi:histidine triad (HIT) family protein